MNIDEEKRRSPSGHTPPTLRTLRVLASPSARSYNRRVSGFVPSALRPNPRYARTSDTRQTLCGSLKDKHNQDKTRKLWQF